LAANALRAIIKRSQSVIKNGRNRAMPTSLPVSCRNQRATLLINPAK
jgi:hypothetical protein